MEDVDRTGFAEKSQAALKRETEAMEAFDKIRAETEEEATGKTTVELLQPSTHLTAACWKTFRQHVTGHPGWKTSRKEANAEEKKSSGEKRSGKVYFTFVTFDPKAAGKATGTKATKKAAKKKKEEVVEEVEEEDEEEAAEAAEEEEEEEDAADAKRAPLQPSNAAEEPSKKKARKGKK